MWLVLLLLRDHFDTDRLSVEFDPVTHHEGHKDRLPCRRRSPLEALLGFQEFGARGELAKGGEAEGIPVRIARLKHDDQGFARRDDAITDSLQLRRFVVAGVQRVGGQRVRGIVSRATSEPDPCGREDHQRAPFPTLPERVHHSLTWLCHV